jgi:hypothetical protein
VPRSSKNNQQQFIGVGIALAVAIGAGLGVAMGSLAFGMGIGVAMGIAFGVAMSWAGGRAASRETKMEPVAPGPDSFQRALTRGAASRRLIQVLGYAHGTGGACETSWWMSLRKCTV